MRFDVFLSFKKSVNDKKPKSIEPAIVS